MDQNSKFFLRFKNHLSEKDFPKSGVLFGLVLVFLFLISASIAPQIGSKLGNLSAKKQKQASLAAMDACKTRNWDSIFEAPDERKREGIVSLLTAKSEKIQSDIAILEQKKSTDTDFEAEISRNLVERKLMLIETMRRDPKAAAKGLIGGGVGEKAKAIAFECIEKEEVVVGKLSVTSVHYADDVGDTHYVLDTEDGARVNLYFAKMPRKNLISQMEVEVKGFKLDNNLLVVDGKDVQFIDKSDAGANVRGAATAPDSMGVRKVKTYLVYFNNQTKPDTLSGQALESIVSGEANQYIQEVSYNKTSLEVNKSNDWSKLDINYTCYPTAITSAVKKLAESNNINLATFKHLVIITPLDCGWNGGGSVGPDTDAEKMGLVGLGVSWFNMSKVNAKAFEHELGHNLGAGHSNYWDCRLGPVTSSNCVLEEYGDFMDVMGTGKGHFNAAVKDNYGWLAPSNMVEARTGTYSIEPIETATQGLKLVRIPRGDGDFLFVEYRQPLGFDSVLSLNTDLNAFNGVTLHILETSNRPLLVHPGLVLNRSKVAVEVGQKFMDPVSQVEVKVLEKTASSVKVQLTDFLGVTPPRTGDVDCNGKIDSVDALLILKTVAGIPVINTKCTGGGIDQVAAHVDGDTDIDAVDALRVLQQVAGIRQIGSASFNAGFSDSDGDQIADSQEAQYPCMKPTVADANSDYDADSIAGMVIMTNISEIAWGTNPCVADTDGDGYKDGVEVWVGTDARQRCGVDAWPADFNNDKKVTILDITGFSAPVRRLDTSPGDANYNKRWDLVPGRGAFAKDINVSDLTSVTIVAPPMLGGLRAMNGPACTPN